MNITLSGKTALVAGGSRGIGAAVCHDLLESGCAVAVTHTGSAASRDGVTELQRLAARLNVAFRDEAVDCANEAGMARLVETVRDWSGAIDYLVYCAGFTSPVAFAELDPVEWRRVVDINLNGAFIALHHVLPAMATGRTGSVVLIGSAAVASGGGGRADYVSAKAGLEGLNRAVAREYGPLGVRCNLVHPSLIETAMLRQRHPDPAKRAQLTSGIPLRRLGQPQDVAHLVCFLLSDQAAYITGQSIFVDGGRTFCGR